MPAQVRGQAPDFTAKAVSNYNIVNEYKLSSNRGKYVVLFFYPLDFTFVCPTEIISFSDRIADFEKRNCQVIGVSVDSEYAHLAWIEQPRKEGGLGELKYPLVSDLTKKISTDYGVLMDGAVSLRGLFLIDKEGVVRAMTIHDLPLGRSVDESLRVLDALQHFEKHGEVCPANWKPGEATIDTKNPDAYFKNVK